MLIDIRRNSNLDVKFDGFKDLVFETEWPTLPTISCSGDNLDIHLSSEPLNFRGWLKIQLPVPEGEWGKVTSFSIVGSSIAPPFNTPARTMGGRDDPHLYLRLGTSWVSLFPVVFPSRRALSRFDLMGL